LSGLYEFTASAGVRTTSDVIGCLIFVIHLYGGLALALEDVQHRTVISSGRRGEARSVIESNLGEQIGLVEKRLASASSFSNPISYR
jgi:hypothetical protein